MSDYTKEQLISFYNQRKVDVGTTWLLFLLVGWSYGSLGSIGKQICYYLTGGGFGLWTLYVLFTLNSKIKKYNREIAVQVGLTDDTITMMGL